MSYSPTEAKNERQTDVYNALNTRDSQALYHLADLFKEEGDDEEAERLQTEARKIDREDQAYDEANNN